MEKGINNPKQRFKHARYEKVKDYWRMLRHRRLTPHPQMLRIETIEKSSIEQLFKLKSELK